MQPGVVYTTFHNPETGANVVTTEHSDWATNCPEYKVTAVQITPANHRSKWQNQFDIRSEKEGKIIEYRIKHEFYKNLERKDKKEQIFKRQLI